MRFDVPTRLRRLAPGMSDRQRPGQAIVLAAIMMMVLLAASGLTVDVGLWLVAKARLQRAVDAAALSGVLDRPQAAQTDAGDLSRTTTSTKAATVKAQQ